ncbi:DUF262 domain-containing protein [Bacillus cereus]|uniref:DUF262 domain-containing protein n=1 Tax=Bacillus cereus TaxID=1396 RepID=UPI0018CDEA24|nr:DUF262 domain-containing protein [Bacillus cereus]MBG9611824.1 hypothetical protein [Bacillus cereus]
MVPSNNNLPIVNMDRSQFSVFELVNRFQRGDIELQPAYQRGYVWNLEKDTKLVESILMNYPIPPLYFAERDRGQWEVIDGQQRLRAIINFVQGEYKLSNTSIPELEGMFFQDMELSLQRKMQEYTFFVNILKRSSDPEIKYEVFLRMNSGGKSLTIHELALAKLGKKKNWIRKLAINEEFLKLTSKHTRPNGYNSEEMVIRFLAFYFLGYRAYKGKMYDFLLEFAESIHKYDWTYDYIEEIFVGTMKSLRSVFGEDVFCKTNNFKKINMALFDILTYSFARCMKCEIVNSKKNIDDRLSWLLQSDLMFVNSLKHNTSNKKMIMYRFETWMSFMNNIGCYDDGGLL